MRGCPEKPNDDDKSRNIIVITVLALQIRYSITHRRVQNCCIAFITQLIVTIVIIMNNETTCFLCTSSVLVRRCLSCRFHGDEAAFGLRREKKAGRSKESQSEFVFLSPPSGLNMDSSKPLGSTTWTDLRPFPSGSFLRTMSSSSYRNRKELFSGPPSFPAQTCLGFIVTSVQSEVRVFVLSDASASLSHRFRGTNSVLILTVCVCAQCKPQSEVQIH